jgi:hypothetical protein
LPGVQTTFGEASWTSPSKDGTVNVRRAAGTLLGVREGSAVFWDHCSLLVRRIPSVSFTFVSIPEHLDDGSDGLPEGVAQEGIGEFCGRNLAEPVLTR